MQKKPGQRGKGRRKGEYRIAPEDILGAAIELFAIRGFMDTSMQSIADRLGISQSAVMYYFPSRQKLFEGCLGLIQARNKHLVDQEMGPEDNALARLRKHFHQNLMWAVKAPEEAQVILLVYSLASYDGYFSALNTAMLQAARQKIYAYLLAGQREGIFLAEMEASVVAEILHDSLLAGILTWLTTQRDSKKRKASLDSLKNKWDMLIRMVTGAKF